MPRSQKRGTAPRRPQGENLGDQSGPLDPHTAPTIDAAARPSKSQRKREAHALQALGAQLVALPPAQLARIALPARPSAARWRQVGEWVRTSYTLVAPKTLAARVLAEDDVDAV